MDGQTNVQTNRRRVQAKGETACAMLLPWRFCDNNNDNNNNNDNLYSTVKQPKPKAKALYMILVCYVITMMLVLF